MKRLDHNQARGLLFDLDGTLSDYVGGARHALELVWTGVAGKLAPHGKKQFLDCYWRVFNEVEALARSGAMSTLESGGRAPRFSRVLGELGVAGDDGLLDEMARLYTMGRLEGARLFPGAAQALAALSKHYIICLITEGSGPNQRAQIDKLGIGDYLNHIVISHEVGLHKPDPELLRHALGEAGLEPGECLMIGDRIDWDLVPAAALGMRTMLFAQKNMYLDLREKMGFEPDWIVRDYGELTDVLLPGGRGV
jgi:HAD superfamily hydrolase (TIGR01549 family)